MRLKGFSNGTLNLSFVDVQLVGVGNQNLLTCAGCKFISKQMFYSSCNHTYCGDCLWLLSQPDSHQQTMEIRCALCKTDAVAMKLNLPESFVARLQCHCPQCNLVVSVESAKAHLRACTGRADSPQLAYMVDTQDETSLRDETNDTQQNQDVIIDVARVNETAVVAGASSSTPEDASDRDVMSCHVDDIRDSMRQEFAEMLATSKDDLRNEVTQTMNVTGQRLMQQLALNGGRRTVHAVIFPEPGDRSLRLITSFIHCGDLTFVFRCAKNTPEQQRAGTSTDSFPEIEMVVCAVGDQREARPSSVAVGFISPNGSPYPRAIKALTGNELKAGQTIHIDHVSTYQPNKGSIIKIEFNFDPPGQ